MLINWMNKLQVGRKEKKIRESREPHCTFCSRSLKFKLKKSILYSFSLWRPKNKSLTKYRWVNIFSSSSFRTFKVRWWVNPKFLTLGTNKHYSDQSEHAFGITGRQPWGHGSAPSVNGADKFCFLHHCQTFKLWLLKC